jgi:ABC-2 type transport system permease protein
VTVVVNADRLRTTRPRQGAFATLVMLDLRLVILGAAVLVALIPGLTAIVVWQYAVTFATTPEQVQGLEVLAGNPAIRVLFGEPRALDLAGGFTVWRTGVFTAVAAAAWALTTTTRLTRGQEDSGLTWLTLVGPLRLELTLLAHLLAVAAVIIIQGLALGLVLVVTGAGGPGAAVYATGTALVGLLFAAVGAASGQLLGERRAATGLAAGLLVVGLLLRMVADGVESLAWALWLTPFGLLSLSAAYAEDRWAPLGVLALAAVAAGAAALIMAARRDVGSGLLPGRQDRRPWLRLLRGVGGFAVRRSLPAFVGWSLALAAYFLLVGLLAVSLTDFLAANPRFAELAAAAGFGNLTTVEGYIAALLLLLAVPLGLFATSRVDDQAQDEAAGRTPLLLSRPVGRIRWAGHHTAVVAAATLLLALLSGSVGWLGIRAVGAGLGFGEAVAGALNVVVVGWLSLGAAVLALGWVPRFVTLIGILPVVGGFVVWVLADTLDWPDWVGRLSPFSHVAPVPAAAPNWPAQAAMLAIAAALVLVGLIGFARRDVRG